VDSIYEYTIDGGGGDGGVDSIYEYTIDGGGTGAVEEGGPHII
jgi:hypothetical protein